MTTKTRRCGGDGIVATGETTNSMVGEVAIYDLCGGCPDCEAARERRLTILPFADHLDGAHAACDCDAEECE